MVSINKRNSPVIWFPVIPGNCQIARQNTRVSKHGWLLSFKISIPFAFRERKKPDRMNQHQGHMAYSATDLTGIAATYAAGTIEAVYRHLRDQLPRDDDVHETVINTWRQMREAVYSKMELISRRHHSRKSKPGTIKPIQCITDAIFSWSAA